MAETKATKETWTEGTGIITEEVGDYSFPRSFTPDVEKKTVAVTHVTKCDDGRHVYIKTVLDFSTAEESDLLEMAAKNIIIACRGAEFRTRNAKAAIEELEGTSLMALDYHKRERAGKDPVKNFKNTVAALKAKGLTPEEIIALIS